VPHEPQRARQHLRTRGAEGKQSGLSGRVSTPLPAQASNISSNELGELGRVGGADRNGYQKNGLLRRPGANSADGLSRPS
jgi:hypothetical protein